MKDLVLTIACKLFHFTLIIGLLTVVACPRPISPTVSEIISCTGESLSQNGIPLIPKVNDCLTGAVEWEDCLLSLITPTAAITEDILACVLRDQGGKFAQTADDELENKAACRADAFISERKYKFEDGYDTPVGVDPLACGG